jgi:hypothetical protein
VFKVTPGGTLSVLAGNGNDSDSGDGGPANQAGINGPFGVAVDSSGNGIQGDTGNGGPALSAEIGGSDQIAVFGSQIYLAEGGNEVILVLSGGQTSSSTPAITSGGGVSASAFGEFASAAPGSWIEIYGTNLAGDTRPWQTSDFNGVNAPTMLDGLR